MVNTAECKNSNIHPSLNFRIDDYDLQLVIRAKTDERSFDNLFNRPKSQKIRQVMARRYWAPGADFDDLLQIANIGFWFAVRDFNPERDTKFLIFMKICIKRLLITFLKFSTRQKQMPLNFSRSYDACIYDGSTETLLNKVPDYDADPIACILKVADCNDLLVVLSEFLSTLEYDILIMRYIEGLDYEQIAHIRRCSIKRVNNALQRVKKKALKHKAKVLNDCYFIQRGR